MDRLTAVKIAENFHPIFVRNDWQYTGLGGPMRVPTVDEIADVILENVELYKQAESLGINVEFGMGSGRVRVRKMSWGEWVVSLEVDARSVK
jgi:hypothetical protein